jgi:hypothetical protein
LPISSKPVLQYVCGFLWQVTAAFPVEGVVIETDMLLKSNVAIGIVIAWVRWAGVVGVVRSVIARVDSYLRLLVVVVPRFVH